MHRVGVRIAVSVVSTFLPAVASAQSASTEPGSAPQTTREGPTAAPPASTEAPVRVDSPPTTPEQRIADLERRLRHLEEKRGEGRDGLEGKGFEKDRLGDKGVALAYGIEGVGVVSADGKFQFRFRPLIQADGHFFIGAGTNTFFLRRVQPTVEGTAFEYFDWRLAPELAAKPLIQDAYVNVRLYREIQFRAGQFSPPVGFERLLAESDLPFLERGLPTDLVPDRDIGAELHGEILGGTLIYAAGIFNGADDGISGDPHDNSDKKDLAGRIMLRPFQPTFVEPLRKLSLGIAATRGTHVGSLSPYQTPVQTTFFQYADGVTAGGTLRRVAPQASYYLGPFGVFGEYTRSTHVVVAPGMSARLSHDAWQVSASFFVTGEEASFTGVTPKHALNPRNFGTGAVELVARYGELKIDAATSRLNLADPTQSARKASDWGVGANWHMARNFKLMANFEHTSFSGGAASGDRPSEKLFLMRLQAAY